MRKVTMVLFLAVVTCDISLAQTAPPAGGDSQQPHVMSLMHFIHAVNELDPTLTFYKEVFGFDIPEPKDSNGPEHGALHGIPGLTLRATTPKFPNETDGIEFTRFGNVDRKPGQALPTDPGAIEMLLPVRDIDAVCAALKKRGAPIVTTGGEPVKIQTSTGMVRSIVARDPDGYLVQAIEVPAADAATPGTLQAGVSLIVAVQDMDAAVKFWHDNLGFDFTGGDKFTHDKAMAALFGAPSKSEYRYMDAKFPTSKKTRIEFYEWKGMTRTPFRSRVPDPGTGGMVMRVNDLDQMLANLNAQGITAESGKPIWFSPTIKDIFVKDPNGVNLELYQMVPRQKPANP
jgi:catechol 2,3-dioxygenase-like lactoylglutathione lyase family enzyme